MRHNLAYNRSYPIHRARPRPFAHAEADPEMAGLTRLAGVSWAGPTSGQGCFCSFRSSYCRLGAPEERAVVRESWQVSLRGGDRSPHNGRSPRGRHLGFQGRFQ